MKVILVNGGPHQDGCTNLALEEIEKTLQENGVDTEKIWLGNKPISGCIGCAHCIHTDKKCFIDDCVNDFLDKANEAEGFVFGSPVHFAAATGNITSFLDRVFYGKGKLFAGKLYASVVSCRRGGASAAFDQLNKYGAISNMYIVGSSYWNQIHGNTKEEAMQDLEGLQTMRNLGKNMAYLLKCMENAEKSGIDKPVYEKRISTNFIR